MCYSIWCIYDYIYIFVSPCVGGLKVRASGTVYTDCILLQKTWHSVVTRIHKSSLIQYVYDIKRSPSRCYVPSGLALYIVYVPSRHDLSNAYIFCVCICQVHVSRNRILCTCIVYVQYNSVMNCHSPRYSTDICSDRPRSCPR